jgi:hypothetical protein
MASADGVPLQDTHRLPDGFKRVGYDSDEHKCTFIDAEGNLWKGKEGEAYGEMTCGEYRLNSELCCLLMRLINCCSAT